jgi:hypothetical protein
MMIRKAYTGLPLTWCMTSFLSKFLAISAFFLLLFPSVQIFSQDEYNEISVFVEVPQVGGSEISAAINGNELLLSVTELFDFLKILNSPDERMETVSGFFINPEAKYIINRSENIVTYQDKIYKLGSGDIIRTESNLYLNSAYFGSIFGLECNFNFRSLSVKVKSKMELPMIREMRQEEMRRNINRLKGDTKADTSIGRSYPLFKFGMADWSALSTQDINGKSDTRLNLSLGGMIAHGEATANLNYNSTDPFNEKQQYYLMTSMHYDRCRPGKLLPTLFLHFIIRSLEFS